VKTVRLGSIAESLPCDYGDDPADGAPSFDVVKVSNVSGEGQFHGDFEKRRFRDDQLADLLVKEGELLVVKSSGSKANILSGKTAICGADRADQIVASNFLLRLRVDTATAVPRFLWYVLNSGASKAFVKTIVGASTYPNLKWSLYASHPIPLPPLAEQRRIAEVLDRAEALRAKRRAALAQLDSLTQSLFLDLFGDPATNPKGWLVSPLSDLGQIHTGKTPPTKLEGMFSGDIPFATPGDLDDGLRRTERTLTAQGAEYSKVVRAGSALVGCIGNIGKMAKTPVRTSFNQQINAVEWGSRIDDDYGINALPFQKHQMLSNASSTVVPILNKSGFSKVTIPVPPISLQREFARRVTAVEALKAAQRASLAELDALFASLQHRAFRGEL
jgi:type I restriction enzyme S subunit